MISYTYYVGLYFLQFIFFLHLKYFFFCLKACIVTFLIEGAVIHALHSAVSSSNRFHLYTILHLLFYLFLYDVNFLYGNEVNGQ